MITLSDSTRLPASLQPERLYSANQLPRATPPVLMIWQFLRSNRSNEEKKLLPLLGRDWQNVPIFKLRSGKMRCRETRYRYELRRESSRSLQPHLPIMKAPKIGSAEKHACLFRTETWPKLKVCLMRILCTPGRSSEF